MNDVKELLSRYKGNLLEMQEEGIEKLTLMADNVLNDRGKPKKVECRITVTKKDGLYYVNAEEKTYSILGGEGGREDHVVERCEKLLKKYNFKEKEFCEVTLF